MRLPSAVCKSDAQMVASEISTKTSPGPHFGKGRSASSNGWLAPLKMAQRALGTSPGEAEGLYKAVGLDRLDNPFFDPKTAVFDSPKRA